MRLHRTKEKGSDLPLIQKQVLPPCLPLLLLSISPSSSPSLSLFLYVSVSISFFTTKKNELTNDTYKLAATVEDALWYVCVCEISDTRIM